MKPKFAFLLLSIVLCLDNPNVASAQTAISDSIALVDLYQNTDGVNWINNSGWLNGPVDTWYGITVYNGRVSDVSLGSNNLNGIIPSSFGNLAAINNLYLDHNKLSGDIPSSLGNFIYINYFYLNNNCLTGHIPSSLADLGKSSISRFLIVDMSYNRLNGHIPAGLNSTNHFYSKFLYLHHNNLGGKIPPALGNFSSGLKVLDLEYNQLTGSIPDELSNLYQLQKLYLNNNRLTGKIPSALGILHDNLVELDLSNNQLKGAIPAELGDMLPLQILRLGNNQLNGDMPPSLGNLRSLTELNLRFNNLKDSIPPEFGNLSNLQHLSLTHNDLTGNIPSSLINLNNLISLNVSYNRLHGNVPSFLTGMPVLRRLFLGLNYFTFDGLEQLVQHDFDSLEYASQKKIVVHQSNNMLSVYAGGTLSNNTYTWYKDGNIYATKMGDSTLPVTQSGAYYVQVVNSIAAALTLYSDTILYSTVKQQEQRFAVIDAVFPRNNFLK